LPVLPVALRIMVGVPFVQLAGPLLGCCTWGNRRGWKKWDKSF
jgi:hypothetical protein